MVGVPQTDGVKSVPVAQAVVPRTALEAPIQRVRPSCCNVSQGTPFPAFAGV